MRNILVASLVFGCFACQRKPEVPSSPPPQTVASPVVAATPLPAPTRAGEALARLDSEIAFHRKQGDAGRGWLHYEQLSGALLARARLTGRVDDYVEAGAALERAFATAPAGSGPFFSLALYKYTVHQIGEVEPAIASAERQLLRKVADQAASAGLRGDLALHRGDLVGARELYRQALKLERSPAAVARIAFLDLKTGAIDAARTGYEEAAALARGDDSSRAWALLQRGIVELEQNDPAAAHRWFTQADEAFTGWYLIEEHIAEAKLLLGEIDAAIALYESVIARTQSGEFMGALGACYAAKGDHAKEAKWLEQAKAAFERDLAKLPSAAAGHALEFYIEHDPARALQLAKTNFELRPNHDARTQLAQALLLSGDAAGARAVLAPVLESGWVSPDFLATVAVVFDGEPAGEQAATRVGAVDPKAVSELRAMLSQTP